jgi:hypothetical protein
LYYLLDEGGASDPRKRTETGSPFSCAIVLIVLVNVVDVVEVAMYVLRTSLALMFASCV